ncbi:MAG TPA: PrsW family intramembrane metalloprotease [Ignavibacteriaceae bacterium]|nr:PrsW family intramembrane metalloprotease [Ignavibacteriaceae bacterium]
MIVITSLLAAVVPILFYLFLLWKYDRYDPEPLGLYFRNFLWGAVGAVFLAIIGTEMLTFATYLVYSDEKTISLLQTVAYAPLIEEATKGLFLFGTVISRKFDNMTDGIVYGGAIGLGFGMTENFLYFINYGETVVGWIMLVIIRTLFTAVMHCVTTGTFGAFLGYAKFAPAAKKFMFPVFGFVIAVFIHFAWNFSVSFESTSLIGFLFLILTISLFLGTFARSISMERKMIFSELSEESTLGLIPPEHLDILNSKIRENAGWIDESIRKNYISLATTLAFRKMQARNSAGYNRLFYQSEVAEHRNKISELLAKPELLADL